jgi:uncharacterized protein
MNSALMRTLTALLLAALAARATAQLVDELPADEERAGEVLANPARPDRRDTPDEPDEHDGAALEARGFDYWFGRGVARDRAEALRWFERAAAQNRPLAQLRLAAALQVGEPRDPKRALEWSRAAAAQGIASAQVVVGAAYFAGEYVPRDLEEGLKWLRAGAAQQEPGAVFALSRVYRNGEGVEPDASIARELLIRAAELASPPARVAAAFELLYAPDGDVSKGLYFLEKGAAAGDTEAKYRLAREYMLGLHVARDYAVAARGLGEAADAKHALAALWLAELHERGLGVDRDAQRASILRTNAINDATLSEKNSFAWDVSVGDAEFRNGALAVTIMEDALAGPRVRVAAYLDTLAAAYAANGQFDRAIATQTEAIGALQSGTRRELVAEFESRLALYRGGTAYRQDP